MHEFTHLRGREAAFPEAEFAARQAAARAAIAAAGHDALVVTGPETIYWLTGRQTAGYFAFQALLVPAEGNPALLVRQLELPGAAASTWLDDIQAYPDGADPAEALAALVRGRGLGRPALERDGWFVAPALAARIDAALGSGPLPDGSGLLAPLRAVKSAAELAAIRAAARYAQAGLAAGLDACAAGTDENAVAAAMLAAATAAGSEAVAMEPLVASGPRSGLPHMTWRRRRLEPGDAVFLELAGSHARYHAALMRSVWIGPPPVEAQRMMDCALRALDAALAAIRPRPSLRRPARGGAGRHRRGGLRPGLPQADRLLDGRRLRPGLGEGALLSLFTGENRPIEPGMVFHLPATLRRYGAWTVGASETVIVTANGVEPLSDLPRSLTLR
ncbi:M24 family metallopeptidase [Methylobacterium oryzae CBMB20]